MIRGDIIAEAVARDEPVDDSELVRLLGVAQRTMRELREERARRGAAIWQRPNEPAQGDGLPQASATDGFRLRRGQAGRRYRPSGLGMGKLLARPGRSFSRKLMARRPVAICFVLRRGNWNSATPAVLNQHLAITHQIQTLRHAVPPICSAAQRLRTRRECERFHRPGPQPAGSIASGMAPSEPRDSPAGLASGLTLEGEDGEDRSSIIVVSLRPTSRTESEVQ
jgi:hypothetical protein